MDHLCYFCLVLLCFHARLFVACWERADLLALVCDVLSLSLWYPGSGVVLDCIDS